MRAALALLLLAACAQPAPTPAVAGQTGTEAAVPRVILPDGSPIRVELATDPETRAQGLMYRDRLADDAGMLFMFNRSEVRSFWMKDTLIALDIVWIDENRRIVHVKHDVPPCRSEPCPSYDPGVPAKYVLELGAGVARKHSLAEGGVVKLEGFGNVAVR